MKSCDSCISFDGGAGHKDLGRCRLYPPQVVISPTNGQTHTLWPLVAEADWCGEWEGSAQKRAVGFGVNSWVEKSLDRG